MPKGTELKCYFGCVVDGSLHRYPKWDYPHADNLINGSPYSVQQLQHEAMNIYNNVRLCYRHFEEKFQLPSHCLTKNAVPTLNKFSLSQTEEQPSTSAVSVAYEERLPATSGTYSLELTHIMAPIFGGEGASTSTALPNEERPPTTAVHDSSNSTRTVPPHPKRTCYSKPTDKAIVRLNEKQQKLREKCKTQSRKLHVAKKWATSKNFLKYIEKLPDAAQTFMKIYVPP